ncbi:MAG TPA: AMP-binding protein, partial [Steroidobacteraceae bacterium]
FTGGLGAHYGAERAGMTVIPVSGGRTERQVQLVVDFKPDLIMVTPSYLLTIIDQMHKDGIEPRETSLRVGVLGAEPWTRGMRDEIENTLGIDATDIYGLSEVIGPGVAQECVETKDGPTLWEDHFYPEIIDPETEQVLPDGEQGELVFTTLTREASPVVRFRTHDLSRLLPGTARSMRRMERVTGRTDDMMIIRGVNCFPTQFEELIVQVAALQLQYLCVLDRADRLDTLILRVEARSDASPAEREKARAELSAAIKSTIGISVDVEIADADTIERSIGKAQRILDRRKK